MASKLAHEGNSKLELCYNKIVQNTELHKGVMDYLISLCVMTKDDREEVNKEPTPSGRNRIILDILIGRPYETCHHLKNALQMDPMYKDLVNDLDFTTEITDVCDERCSHLLKDEHKINDHTVKLYKNYKKCVDQIADPERICDKLNEEDLSLEDLLTITKKKIVPKRNRCLLSKLIGGSLSAYTNFVKILSEDDMYKELADDIEQTPVTEHDKHLLQIGLIKCAERQDSRNSSNKDRNKKVENQLAKSNPEITRGKTDFGMSDKETTVNTKTKDTNNIDILVKACKTGSKPDVESFIKQDGNVNSTDKNGLTPIYYATYCKHIEICKLLIDAGANVNQRVECINGDTPFICACKRGMADIVELYINHGVNVDNCNSKNETPLLIACLNGHEKLIDLLYSSQRNTIQSSEGWIPLTAACYKGHLSVIEALIKKGVDINIVDGDGRSPIYTACKYGKSPVVNFLLSKGCDISKTDPSGVTPFMAACNGGYKDIVENLVEISPADIKTADKSGVRPIDIACRNGHWNVCEVLIVKGIDINEAGNDGWTPLMEACSLGHLLTAKYLIEKGAKINTTNNDKENALYLSCFSSNLKLFQFLCEKGAEIDIRNNNEQTPLHIASRVGSYTICEQLISRKLDMNKKDINGRTPLIEACCKDHVNIIELLLENKATFNFNLIHIACEHGSYKVLKYLLANETSDRSINKRNIKNDSPLDLACRFGHVGVCKLLIKKGANKEDENPETKKTPLMEACSKGHFEIVEHLLSENVNKDYANANNQTALSCAEDAGNIDIQLLLLK